MSVRTSDLPADSAADSAAEAPAESIFSARYRLTTFGVVILITMIAFEAMAVATVLPTAARDLHSIGSFGWAYTGFLVASVVGLVTAGQVSDSRGPQLPLAAGLVCFTAGLLISGTAVDMPQFIAGRVVQGLGGGLLITTVYVVIGEVYPDSLTPKVFAASATAWVFPSLVGPVLSGVLAQHASWRWVFLGLVPVIVVCCALMLPVLKMLHRPDEPIQPRRMVPYAVVVAVAVAALEQIGQHPPELGVLVPVVVVALVLLAWALRSLLPSGVLAVVLPFGFQHPQLGGRAVAGPVVMRGLLSGAFFGVEALVPLALTEQHGYGATLAGMPLVISGVTWALGSWWQGRAATGDEMTRRIWLVRAGFTCVLASAALVAIASQRSSPAWLSYPAWALAGLGAGMTMSSIGVLLLRFTTDADRGADSAALQLSDATASALTTGLGGVLVAAAARGSIGYGRAFAIVDLVMVLVAALGALTAGRLRTRP